MEKSYYFSGAHRSHLRFPRFASYSKRDNVVMCTIPLPYIVNSLQVIKLSNDYASSYYWGLA